MDHAETGAHAQASPDEGAVERTVEHCTTPDDHTLALTHLTDAANEAVHGPAILLHGSYTNRRFWLTEDGFGLGPYLSRRGFDVWIPELRGHGLSPKADGFEDTTAEDHIRQDVPAIHRAVTERTDAWPIWVGHSAGGLYLLGALSRRWVDPGEVRAVAVFGTQISEGEAYLKLPLVAPVLKTILGLIGHFPAPRLGLGPEIEPVGEINEMIDWKAQGRWVDRSGTSYHEGLATLEMPVVSYAGAADETDPPEGCKRLLERIGSDQTRFQLLAKSEGFARDYGHAEMIASRAAAEDVWPDLADWMAEHA